MEKKISKKTLNKSFRNWYYGHLTCFSQEHMQTFGYLCAMLPIIEELYKTKEEQKKAMQTYTAFFNTEPQVGSVVVGITASLEEAKANGADDINAETINGLRAGLMGPLAGIGDSLVVGTLIPILLGIAMGLSTGGSPIGAIFYIIVWNLLITWGMRFLYFKGYELGGKAIDFLVGERATAIRESIVMLGTIVIGAVAGTWIYIPWKRIWSQNCLRQCTDIGWVKLCGAGVSDGCASDRTAGIRAYLCDRTAGIFRGNSV